MPQFRSVEFKAREGLSVELSIDRVIQDRVEDEIKMIMEGIFSSECFYHCE